MEATRYPLQMALNFYECVRRTPRVLLFCLMASALFNAYADDPVGVLVQKTFDRDLAWDDDPVVQEITFSFDGKYICRLWPQEHSRSPQDNPVENSDAGYRLIRLIKNAQSDKPERATFQAWVRPWGRWLDRRHHWLNVTFNAVAIDPTASASDFKTYCGYNINTPPPNAIPPVLPPRPPSDFVKDGFTPTPVTGPTCDVSRLVLRSDCACYRPNSAVSLYFIDSQPALSNKCLKVGSTASVYVGAICPYAQPCNGDPVVGTGTSLKVLIQGISISTPPVYIYNTKIEGVIKP